MMNFPNQDRQTDLEGREPVTLSAAKGLAMRTEMLRCAQHDTPWPILLVNVHHRLPTTMEPQYFIITSKLFRNNALSWGVYETNGSRFPL